MEVIKCLEETEQDPVEKDPRQEEVWDTVQVGRGGVAVGGIAGLRDALDQVIEFVRVRAPAERDHLDRAGEDDRGLAGFGGGVHEVLEPVLARQAVGVREHEPLAAGPRDAVVARGIGSGRAAVLDAGVGREVFGAREVFAAVVDEDDFELVAREGLVAEAFEQGGYAMPVAIYGYDDAAAWRRGGTLGFTGAAAAAVVAEPAMYAHRPVPSRGHHAAVGLDARDCLRRGRTEVVYSRLHSSQASIMPGARGAPRTAVVTGAVAASRRPAGMARLCGCGLACKPALRWLWRGNGVLPPACPLTPSTRASRA